jgi:hypothetical protein
MSLTTTDINTAWAVMVGAPEFAPYERYLHCKHSTDSRAQWCISVVLQYEVNRYLSELIELDVAVLCTTGDVATALCEKIATALRRLIGRAHSGKYIPGSEMFGELQRELQAADKAFE